MADVKLVGRGCTAGFFKRAGAPNQCVSCALTAGTYVNNPVATACLLCTNKPATNAYYLVPRTSAGGFNGSTNNCPW